MAVPETSGAVTSWPTVPMLAVLHAMTNRPGRKHTVDEIAEWAELERRVVHAALGALMGRGWADTDYRRIGQRGRMVYLLTDDGCHETATILKHPAAGIPTLVQERLRACRLSRRDRTVLNALVAGGLGQRWTLPAIHRAVLVIGLPEQRTNRGVCAELTRLLWRGWVAIESDDRHLTLHLTRAGYNDACTHLHDESEHRLPGHQVSGEVAR